MILAKHWMETASAARPRATVLALALIAGLTAAVATIGLGGQAHAGGEPKELGIFKNWTAFAYSEGGSKVCYAASEPTRKQGKYTKRGDVLALVTHSPGDKSFNVVSIVAGYAYKKGSDVLVNIQGRKFKLFTHEDRAWAPDASTDMAIVTEMKRASRMVVVGASGRGTRTTDTYSLLGFTKAYNKISAACGLKKKRSKKKPSKRK